MKDKKLASISTVNDCIYFFIYSLFNDAFSISDYIASKERVIVNNELGKMWKEAVVA
jgi:hypothetical protein